MRRIYSFRLTYPIIIGIPFMNILTLGLCGFFVNRFLIEQYDPSAFVLLFMFLGMLLICDVALFKYQIFQRCFMKFEVDSDGLQWYVVKTQKNQLKWSEVRTYGVTGYDIKNQPVAFVFFSADPKESSDLKKRMSLGDQRIVIQIREEVVRLLEQNLPSSMKIITDSIEEKRDCFCRKK